GGKTRAILLSIAAGLLLLTLAFIFIPYPLKMDAKGQLLPKDRRYVYAPVEGKIEEFLVAPGPEVMKDSPLVRMHDPQLEAQMLKLQSEIEAAAKEVETLDAEIAKAKPEQRLTMSAERETRIITIYFKTNELNAIRDRVQALPGAKAGYFVV